MMVEPEEWKIFRFYFLLFYCCCGIRLGFSLDADGCRVLENLCAQTLQCNDEVFIQKCGKYLERHKINSKGDAEAKAIPPESLIDQWPFFPENAYGHKHNHNRPKSKTALNSNPRAAQHYKYAYEEDTRGYRSTNEQDNEPETNENEAEYGNVDLESYSDEDYADQQQHPRTEDFKTRHKKRDTEASRDKIGNYAGRVHHDDATSQVYSRLVRLAELKDELDWVNKQLSERSHSDGYYPSRIRKDGIDQIYYLPKSNQADKLEGKKIINEETLNHNKEIIQEKDHVNKESLLHKSVSKNPASLDGLKENRKEENPRQDTESNTDSKITGEVKPEFDVRRENTHISHFQPLQDSTYKQLSKDQKTEPLKDTGVLVLRTSKSVDPNSLKTVGAKVQKILWGIDASKQKIFSKVSVDPTNSKDIILHTQAPSATYTTDFNPSVISHRINTNESLRNNISNAIGFTILGAHSRKSRNIHGPPNPLPKDKNWDEFAVIIAIVGGCTLGLIVASVIICSLKRRSRQKRPIEMQKKEAMSDYEELCRTKMAVNATSPRTMKAIQADRQRHGLVDGQGKITNKSWREEPLAYNMDITTGHVILAYMEEHLNDENKLSVEWEALCNYKADQDETTVGEDSKNISKNRYSNVLPYDHTRVKLRETANVFHSDYINASYITDVDPRNPAYIATQGPLDNTVADFWQMIWEQGVVVIVNLTRLSDMGLPQCHRYWPEEGSDVYNTYQVHLISEHIWCDDYIVRSFYLKHLLTSETRTVTQFHFLTWPDLSVPESAKPVLEFRRKVNKCYRGQACPIVVHCNNGVGRTGTYILIDMVLKKMIKGTKEIDIAATLEHLRDQRPDMVKTKAQFEFTLAAVAEEVTAIVSSLSG